MSRFRKKPVEIEAVRFSHLEGNAVAFDAATFGEPPEDEEVPEGEVYYPRWLEEALGHEHIRGEDGVCLVETREGPLRCPEGNWIIRGVQGEIYPCDPEIFAATYDDVDNAPRWTERLANVERRTPIEEQCADLRDAIEELGADPLLTAASTLVDRAMETLGKWHDEGEPDAFKPEAAE